MTRKEVLDAAAEAVLKDRQSNYESPERNFEMIARLWSLYTGYPINAADVAVMQILLKVARQRANESYADNYIDIAGYAACAAECARDAQPTINEIRKSYDGGEE